LDRWRILKILLLSSSSLLALPSAQEIYQTSIKVLSVDKIKFQVKSEMKSGTYTQKQIFSLARVGNDSKSSSLICFLYPKSIKGTAILLKKNFQESSVLVYFPSLGRTRLIPKEKENDEAFGLGLSFAEIQNKTTKLKNLGEFSKNSKIYYKIEKDLAKEKTIYIIDKENMVIQKMSIYKNKKLVKEVFIDSLVMFHNKKMISKWHIIDYVKNKETLYSIDKKSITSTFNKKIFRRNAITHCKP